MITYLCAGMLLIIYFLLLLYVYKDKYAVYIFNFVTEKDLKLGRKFLQKKLVDLLLCIIIATIVLLLIITVLNFKDDALNIIILVLPPIVRVIFFVKYLNSKHRTSNQFKKHKQSNKKMNASY